jgi:dCTP diphosphatase
MTDRFSALSDEIRGFARARDWEQFHSPKNLAMAVASEAGELLDIFRWTTQAESDTMRGESVRDEIGDVLICLIMLGDRLDIDIVDAARAKVAKNETRYPAEAHKGKTHKRVK